MLTGYSTAELTALTVLDLTPAGNTGDGTRLWEQFVSSGEQRGHYDLRQKDGSFVRVQYLGLREHRIRRSSVAADPETKLQG